MSKKRKQITESKIAEKIMVQVEAMTLAFQRLVVQHAADRPWRFTYAVSLSAEPIAEVKEIQREEVKKN